MSSDGRLPTELEVAGLIRAAEAEGGHAAVLRKGDPERGTLLLFLASRGVISACLERFTDLDGRQRMARNRHHGLKRFAKGCGIPREKVSFRR